MLEERMRNVSFYDAAVDGSRMRFVELASPLPPLGEEVTVTVGETTRKRDRLAEEILLSVWVPQILLLLLAGWIAYRAIVAQTQKLYALSALTRFVNFLGLPSLAVPAGFDSNGMPVAFQLVGHPDSEYALIEIAAECQSRTDWHGVVPTAVAGDISNEHGMSR